VNNMSNINDRIKERQAEIEASGMSYWQKIAEFQLEYEGKRWKLVHTYDTGGHGKYETCQLCGHFPCRYMFVIQHPATGQTKTIGDECVVKYTVDTKAKDVLRRYRTQVTKRVADLNENKPMIVKIEKWIRENGYNGFLNSILYQLWEGKRLSEKQVVATNKILTQEIPGETKEMRNKSKTEQENLIEKAIRKDETLNDWERSFLRSVAEQSKSGRILSEKQITVLERITKKRFEDGDTRKKISYV